MKTVVGKSFGRIGCALFALVFGLTTRAYAGTTYYFASQRCQDSPSVEFVNGSQDILPAGLAYGNRGASQMQSVQANLGRVICPADGFAINSDYVKVDNVNLTYWNWTNNDAIECHVNSINWDGSVYSGQNRY